MADEEEKEENEWEQPEAPPSPLFTGQKEEDYVKQTTDEIVEGVIGQRVLYYPIDTDKTEFHSLYGEAIEKNFLNPIRTFVLIEWEGIETSFEDDISFDEITKMNVLFHNRRISEDQNIFVKAGDFILYGEQYFEILNVGKPRQLFGRDDNRFEIGAQCVRARQGKFNAQ